MPVQAHCKVRFQLRSFCRPSIAFNLQWPPSCLSGGTYRSRRLVRGGTSEGRMLRGSCRCFRRHKYLDPVIWTELNATSSPESHAWALKEAIQAKRSRQCSDHRAAAHWQAFYGSEATRGQDRPAGRVSAHHRPIELQMTLSAVQDAAGSLAVPIEMLADAPSLARSQ